MKKLVFLIVPLFLLSGCYDEIEPDNLSYVTAVGIDESENNDSNYFFTMQFAKTSSISGGAAEEGGKGGDIVENLVIEAPTLYSAVNSTNHILSKNLSMAHIKLIVFSDKIAESGISDFTETIIRSQEIRPNIYFAVSKGEAREYLKNVKPVIEINPTKYYQLLFQKNNYGGIPKNPSYNFIFNQESKYHENVLPLVGVIEEEQEEDGGGENEGDTEKKESESYKNGLQKNAPLNKSAFQYKEKNYTAGEVGVEVKNKSEAMGMAVFKDDISVGYMGSTESLIYNILSGNYRRSYLTFKIPDDETPVTIRAEAEKKTKIDYDGDENKAIIKIYMEGDFVSLSSDKYTENNIEDFEKASSEAVKESTVRFLERTRDEFDSDIIGIGQKARKKFLTEADFEQFNWKERYKDIKFDDNVTLNIRRTGLISRK